MAIWTISKKLNVSPYAAPLVIQIKQYTSDFALKLQLYSTVGDLDIPAGATTKIRGTKRDGNGYELTGTRIGNTCTFSGTKAQMQQMTAAHGRCVFEIVVENNTRELITANFYLDVQRAAMDAGTVTSESIIEEFADFQSKITAAQAAATAAQAQADRAEAAAESIDFGLDSVPTQGSTNAVSSGGVWSALHFAGFSEDAKIALLECFEHVAWVDEHGQTYYDNLYDALYPDTGLVRITAVFEQSSLAVYPETPLNDLKPYLTVTGYYKDGSTARIEDYSLSGTLEVGTSVITTIKDGKTATFNVAVTQDPTLVYELTSGTDISSTPIDTGISIFEPNDDFTILVKASITSIPSDTLSKYLVNHGSVSTGTLRLSITHSDTNLVFTTNIMHGFNTVSVLADECDVWWVIRVRDKHALRMLYIDGNRLVYDADVDISSYISDKTFTGTYKISTYSSLTDYNGCFPGVVNMLRIYNVALQDSDIERIMGIEM